MRVRFVKSKRFKSQATYIAYNQYRYAPVLLRITRHELVTLKWSIPGAGQVLGLFSEQGPRE